VSRGTGVGKVKVISKCNGGVAVPKILFISKPFAYHKLTSKSLIQQLKITYLYNYTSIRWTAVLNLHTGDIGKKNKMITFIKPHFLFCISGIKSKCTRQGDGNLSCRKKKKNYFTT
jgi:hypothetical protein